MTSNLAQDKLPLLEEDFEDIGLSVIGANGSTSNVSVADNTVVCCYVKCFCTRCYEGWPRESKSWCDLGKFPTLRG